MDILDAVAVKLSCKDCGQSYQVPLRNISLSRNIMQHAGCPTAAATECTPSGEMFLADDKDLRDLQQAWRRLSERARKDGGELVIAAPPHPSTQTEPRRKTA